jgi:hypothetical protein
LLEAKTTLDCLFSPSITDVKSARAFALDDDFAVPQAQFYLANVSARTVNLLGD